MSPVPSTVAGHEPAEPAPAPRGRSARWAAVLVAAGLVAGIAFSGQIRTLARSAWRAVVPLSESDWDEQIRRDAVALLDLVSPGTSPESLPAEFSAAWEPRRGGYPPQRLAELRRRLDGYLDFQSAEYAECAAIYRGEQEPTTLSAAAREARDGFRRDFGAAADPLIAEADQLREAAYEESPKVAGYDPDLPDYRKLYEDFLTWLPAARARVAELTTGR